MFAVICYSSSGKLIQSLTSLLIPCSFAQRVCRYSVSSCHWSSLSLPSIRICYRFHVGTGYIDQVSSVCKRFKLNITTLRQEGKIREKEEEQERREGRGPGGHTVHKLTSSLDEGSNQPTNDMLPCFLFVCGLLYAQDLHVFSGSTACLFQEMILECNYFLSFIILQRNSLLEAFGFYSL